MKKWLIILLACVLVIVVLAASGWLWLTRSESGARWALARGAGAVEQLEYETLSGGLASGVTIEGLRFAQAGSRVTAERIELAARIELFGGPRVLVRHLRAAGVDIHPSDEQREADAQPQPFDLSGLASPVAVVVDELDLRELRLHGGEQPLVIDHVHFAGAYHDHVVVDELSVEAFDARVELEGRWPLDNARSGRLAVSGDIGIGDETRQSTTLTLAGSLEALRFDISSEGPAQIDGDGRVDGLPGAPGLDVDLRGQVTAWPGLPVDFEDLALALEGNPTDWRAELDTAISGGGMPPGRWSIAASGGLDSLRVESLAAEILDGRIDGDGELAWGDTTPSARARLELENLDFTSLYPQWPEQGRVSGDLVAATHEGIIEIERLDLAARPGELNVAGSGRIDPSADRLDVALEWRQFAWPPVSDDSEPLIASESGELRLDGRISDWRLQLDALLDSPDTPAARVEARATGSRERATIEALRIDAGAGGELAVDGELAWDPALTAGLNLTVNAFDPGVVLRQLPGQISGGMRLDIAGGEAWRTGIDFDELTGTLRGQAFSAGGRLSLLDAEPQSADIDLALGDNRIEVAGSSDADDWRVDLAADALDQLWPDLDGTAELSGRVRPAQGKLNLEGRIAATDYAEYHLERAEIALSANWLDTPAIDLALNASGLDVRPWDRLEQLELTLEGNCESHRLSVNTNGSRGRIDLAGGGQLAGCLDDFQAWEGQLERLYIGETVAGDWRLADALPLTVDADGATAGPACLTTAAETESRLCLESLDAGEEGRVVAAIEQVPMDLLLMPLDPLLSLTTPLSGRVEANWSAAGLTALDGHLALSPGALRAVGEDRDLLQIDSVRAQFTPEQNAGLLVDLHARVEGETEINGQARMADLRNPIDTRLEGEARIDLPDIGAFGHLLPRFDRLGGRASGRIEAAGPVSAPSVSGRLSLADGELVHAPLGLEIRQIALELEGRRNHATLSGRARSGEGRLELDGEGRLDDDGWLVELHADGERFAFAGADWLQLDASPKLTVAARPDRIAIDGDIGIDRLRAGLPPGSANRIDPSADIEVRGESEEEEAPLADPARRIEGRLAIDLGDDARLAAAGLDTRLAGGIELRWSGDPQPRGRGTIRLPEGGYRAYGQNLEISDGEILFTGHPLDDPRLDIRAVRDIFGDPKVETAGVHISGSARKPEIDLFTDPPTSEENALAYMVTGADFDHAGGQGALNVGFYLLPRLFVSYGVGLFEAGNVLSGRYELSRRWGVRVVSGERDTGVDMSFSVSN